MRQRGCVSRRGESRPHPPQPCRSHSGTPPRRSCSRVTTETRNRSAGEAALESARRRRTASRRVERPHPLQEGRLRSARPPRRGDDGRSRCLRRGARAGCPCISAGGPPVQGGVLRVRDAAAQDTTVALRDLFPGVDRALIASLPVAAEAALEQGIARALTSGIRVLLATRKSRPTSTISPQPPRACANPSFGPDRPALPALLPLRSLACIAAKPSRSRIAMAAPCSSSAPTTL